METRDNLWTMAMILISGVQTFRTDNQSNYKIINVPKPLKVSVSTLRNSRVYTDQGKVLADGDEDEERGEGLQQPVEHVELHRDQVPLLPPRPRAQADAAVLVVLLLPEPRPRLPGL